MDYSINETRKCLECGREIIYGRTDKNFCCEACKDNYHNLRKSMAESFKRRINNTLGNNYKILQELVRLRINSASIADLELKGFRQEYCTSYRKSRYHCEFWCYDIKYCKSDTRLFKIEKGL